MTRSVTCVAIAISLVVCACGPGDVPAGAPDEMVSNRSAEEVFELYVELFPDDANAYDSLGEALMVRGDTGDAIANYTRSLEVDPDNGNAAELLAKLHG